MLNESAALPALIEHLEVIRNEGCEVLIVDGGSRDGSADMARRAGFSVLDSASGRARQMNVGAAAATGDTLVFLHADTRLPPGAIGLLRRALFDSGRPWGFFRVRIEGRSRILRVIAFFMNHRSRLTGIATGDQAMFVRRSTFERLQGFAEQPLMEDVEMAKRLRRIARPLRLPACVTTSGRRWEARGIWRTIVLMWMLRLAYWVGVRPEILVRRYR